MFNFLAKMRDITVKGMGWEKDSWKEILFTLSIIWTVGSVISLLGIVMMIFLNNYFSKNIAVIITLIIVIAPLLIDIFFLPINKNQAKQDTLSATKK